MTEQEWNQILSDYQDGIPIEQIVHEYEMSHPSDIEVFASHWREKYQLGILKKCAAQSWRG